MLQLFKKKSEQEILCPVSGRLIPLKEVKDEAFSSGVLGDGFAIIPEDGCFVSPISGKIEVVFPTGHAYGIKNDNVELMVHIGIDTVELKGTGFESKVTQGQSIQAGEPLAIVDLDLVKSKGYDLTTVVIYTDGSTNGSIEYNQTLKRGTVVVKMKKK